VNVIMIILVINVIKDYVNMSVVNMVNAILALKVANVKKLILDKNVKTESV